MVSKEQFLEIELSEENTSLDWSWETSKPDQWSCRTASAEEIKAAHPEFEEYLGDWLGSQNIVIEECGQILGCCSLYNRDCDSSAIVTNKYVLRSERKQGLGSELSKAVRRYAKEIGYQTLKGGIPGIWKEVNGQLHVADPNEYRMLYGQNGGVDSWHAILNAGSVIVTNIRYQPSAQKETEFFGVTYSVRL